MRYLKYWLEAFTAIALFVVVVTTFLQVFFRFVIKVPAPWTEEVARIAFVYMAFGGAALATKHASHLVVDLADRFPNSLRTIVVRIGYLFSLVFIVAFTYYGFIYAMNNRTQITPALEVSIFYLYLALPLSGMVMFYYMLKHLIADLRGRGEEVDKQ